ncbi:MAG: 5-oxoprolinase subunit PxpA [Anaerolineae bacterium]|nr:LamB/YcsF family protein [Candidatus Roseilinea sp.]MDW8450358.1 5-oxoprolinase subunit PxpA [Anaerolineae bacterium]
MTQPHSFRVILNCDCGEGMADDAMILSHVTAANIACGGHAGDADSMRAALRLCKQFGVSAGAHPSYPDRAHFGRRILPMTPDEITAAVCEQLQALSAIASEEGVTLTHVKPHGALYNQAATRREIADVIARAVVAHDPNLALIGLAGSALIEAGEAAGLYVLREAFADRAYERDGSLRDRDLPDALIQDNVRCLAQAEDIILRGLVMAHDGALIPLRADTICIHSDTPGAAERAAFLRRGLLQAGVELVGVR